MYHHSNILYPPNINISINQRMNGIHCKTFIDEEILSLFTGDDRYAYFLT